MIVHIGNNMGFIPNAHYLHANSAFPNLFLNDEVVIAIKDMKYGKASSLEDIHTKFFDHTLKNTIGWLMQFFFLTLCQLDTCLYTCQPPGLST